MSRRLLRSRPFVVSAAVLLAVLVYQTWTRIAAGQKLTAGEIAEATVSGENERLNLRIILHFAPEQFHFLQLQQLGRIAGAEDNVVYLHGVDLASARQLARTYWIADIAPSERN